MPVRAKLMHTVPSESTAISRRQRPIWDRPDRFQAPFRRKPHAPATTAEHEDIAARPGGHAERSIRRRPFGDRVAGEVEAGHPIAPAVGQCHTVLVRRAFPRKSDVGRQEVRRRVPVGPGRLAGQAFADQLDLALADVERGDVAL